MTCMTLKLLVFNGPLFYHIQSIYLFNLVSIHLSLSILSPKIMHTYST